MFRAGQQIGNYTLVKPLGRGGFGEVWMAMRRAKFVTTKVAVKLPIREQVDAEAIKQEAVLWEQASGHPNVLPIIEADEYDGQIVIVSEYAPDGTLDDLLKREGALPVKRAIEMGDGILRGLEFLHSRRIIHRDIKPANILLQGDTPRLTDFGMSRVLLMNSLSNDMSGTPYYMAPEAFSRKRNVQTDIWSSGVVLYEMLTGKLPFRGNDLGEIYVSVFQEKPAPLPEGVPASLQNVVTKALAKLPAERYASAAEMREDLLNCLAVSASAENISFAASLKTPRLSINQDSVHSTAQPLPTTPVSVADNYTSRTSQNADFRATSENERAEQSQHDSRQMRQQHLQPAAQRRRIFKFKYLAAFAASFVLMLAVAAGGFFYFSRHAPIPFRKGDKFGYATPRKQMVIGAKYDLALPFENDLAVVAVGQRNADGEFAGKYGFIDARGREVVPLEYDYAESFSEELAKVGRFDAATKKIKLGFIDENGAEVIALDYDAAANFSGDLAAVSKDGKWGFINKTGALVVSFKYEAAGNFSDGMAAVKSADNGKFGFIDDAGREVIPAVYDYAGDFSEAVAPVVRDGKTFFINAKGAEAIRFRYHRASRFSEGFALVTLNGKSGFIEKSGGEVIPLQYDNEKSLFSEGFAAVESSGRKGFIDKSGRLTIPFKYTEASDFHNKLARVKSADGKEFYIDCFGTEFYEP